MSAPYVIFELRTPRDSEYLPAAAVQMFSTLPDVYDKPWHWALGQDEHVAFEILAQDQKVSFLCVAPHRLTQYFQGAITASYQEALITHLDSDPALAFTSSTPHLKLGSLTLKHGTHLSLKTYRDFADVDPLVGVLSAMGKLEADDRILIQFVVKKVSDWLRPVAQSSGSSESGQKSPADRKLSQIGLQVGLKIAITSSSTERSELLLTTIVNNFQSVTNSDGNSLVLRRPYLMKTHFLDALHHRQLGWLPNMYLSLDELATLYHLPTQKVAHLNNIAWGKTLLGEPPENLPVLTTAMTAPEKKEINPFARAEYKNNLSVYGLKRIDRRRHMYVIGKTGTGKSTMLANMAINDLKNDEGLCVIDPHGDLVETLLDYVPSRRINDVVYFDPADPEKTVKLNLFEGKNVIHRELIASGIVSIFQKLYAYSWGPRLEYILRNALLTLLTSEQARMSDIMDLLTNANFRAKIVDQLDDEILKNFWVYEYEKMPDRLRTDAIAPILNKVGQFVSSPLVRNVVNATKSSFSVEEIMDEGKILLVNLSQGKLGEDNATLLGAMLITKIQLAAMGRVNIAEQERRDFYLYVDEFQNFATQSFNKILSEARKYRLNLVLANQYIAQIPEDVQKAIFGNCGSIVSFVMGAEDAGVFSKEYGDKYSVEDLVTLGKHQIVNKIAIDNIISLPFPATTLPLAKSSNHNRLKVIKVSRERWARKR
jgi:hypothetical protein